MIMGFIKKKKNTILTIWVTGFPVSFFFLDGADISLFPIPSIIIYSRILFMSSAKMFLEFF